MRVKDFSTLIFDFWKPSKLTFKSGQVIDFTLLGLFSKLGYKNLITEILPAAIPGIWVAAHQSNLYWKTTTSAQIILDGRAPDYLSEKLLSLTYQKCHDTRSRLPYHLIANSMNRVFSYNAVKLANNVSDNDLVRSSDVKKFKRNYIDSVMCKFTLTV